MQFCPQINFLERTKTTEKALSKPHSPAEESSQEHVFSRNVRISKALCKSKDCSKKFQQNNAFLCHILVEMPSVYNFFGYFLKTNKATFETITKPTSESY